METLVQTGIKEITFIIVHAHARVSGNEQADRLAGIATISEEVAMDQNDMLNASNHSVQP
uniref:Uncharacterized protein n=1 Tax=Arion vulgaris TaxID=1028688 RepID=A0A0B7AMW1_9EUPU